MSYRIITAQGYKMIDKKAVYELIKIQDNLSFENAKGMLQFRSELKQKTGYEKIYLTYKKK